MTQKLTQKNGIVQNHFFIYFLSVFGRQNISKNCQKHAAKLEYSSKYQNAILTSFCKHNLLEVAQV